MADGYVVSAGPKLSLQKNKVYANYCNRNQHNNREGLTKIADIAVQPINCPGRRGGGEGGKKEGGGAMGIQLIH